MMNASLRFLLHNPGLILSKLSKATNFTVTQEREVEELVKRWMPYMRVISPNTLKRKNFS